MKRRLILASASAGRRELLEEAGYSFEVLVAEPGVEEAAVAEAAGRGAGAEELALAAARAKAEAVSAEMGEEAVVVAADTVVRAADGEILGKGENAEESAAILRKLAGTVHQVISGAVVIGGGKRFELVHSTSVELRPMSDAEIAAYVGSGRSVGASGGYRIQRRGTDRYLRIVGGSLSNVVGLPMEEIIPILAGMGVEQRNAGA
ncbi:MAG: Maf family nucleotide pyrophosphatase [Planctomycetota bacterium]